MDIEFKPIVTGGIAKQIANSIRDAVLDGRLKVNDRLPTEEELAERFGVSRPTIREALKRLAAQNLVRSSRGPTGGTFITKPSENEIRATFTNITAMLVGLGDMSFEDLLEVRLELECACCRMAAERRRSEDLEAMRAELLVQRDPAVDDVTFCRSDLRFHESLVDATQNLLMRLVAVSVLESLQAVSNMVSYPFRDRAMISSQHEKILEALVQRDGEAAQRAVREQIKYLAGTYAQALSWRETRTTRQGPRDEPDTSDIARLPV